MIERELTPGARGRKPKFVMGNTTGFGSYLPEPKKPRNLKVYFVFLIIFIYLLKALWNML